MRLPIISILLIVTEARRYEDDDAVAKNIDVFEHNFKSSGPIGSTQRLGYPKSGPQRPISFREKARAPYDEDTIGSYHQFEPLLYMKPRFTSARDEAVFLQKHPEFNTDYDDRGIITSPVPNKKSNNATRIISGVKPKPIVKAAKDTVPSTTPDSVVDATSFNWMTCDEFTQKEHFSPKSILNILWEPFYVWSEGYFPTSRLHHFSVPNKTVVQRYKEGIGKYLKKKVDWNAPMLLMSVTRERLLIAVDSRGSFISVPRHPRSDKIKGKKAVFKTIDVRLKRLDSYLAMMFCIDSPHYATIMAERRNVPATNKAKRREAAKLKFKGKGYTVTRGNVTQHKRAKPSQDRKS